MTYYDRGGQPITSERFVALIEDRQYVRLATTRVGALEVSTVWLGIDHSFMFDDAFPIIFETMVFHMKGETRGVSAGEQWRYSTEREALDGHRERVRLLGGAP